MDSIVFTGGGTGGHIIPNLAIIEKIKNYKIYYFGSTLMEENLIKQYNNVTYIKIDSIKFIRKLTLKNFLIPFKLYNSINNAKEKLKEINPKLIFSKGGYVALPTTLAGKKLNIPILTHESDITIGLANKIIAKKAKHLLCSFKITADKYGKNAIFTSSPIRTQIYNGNKENIYKTYNISRNKPTILIMGGSLGSKIINKSIQQNIKQLTQKYNIINIVGKGNIDNSHKYPNNYIQIEFTNQIEDYFSISDIVISRAGSNTIFELLSLMKPTLLIPLPKSTNSRGDQVLNAQYFYNKNVCNLLHQEDLNSKTLLLKIEETFANKQKYIKNINKLEYIDGTDNIIKIIYDTIESKK